MTEALKGAIILAVLERLCLTRNSGWLEEQCVPRPRYCDRLRVLTCMRSPIRSIDYLSIQAQMFQEQRAHMGFAGQIRLFFRHTRRLDA